jgi:rubrerythrin
MVFGKKKSAAQKAEDEAKAAKFWQGEWVCKDCGYIYNRVRSFVSCF